MGHEYVWDDYNAAQASGNAKRLRELELTCDAIATLTLLRLGVKPDRLITAMEKVLRFNEERFGPGLESHYPWVAARRDVVRWMSSDHKSRAQAVV